MKILEIIPNVYQLGSATVNSFLINSSEGITLIDTGIQNNVAKIYKAIEDIGKTKTDIKQIIITHLHPDHCSAAAEIQNELGISVFAHPLDAELMHLGIGSRPYTITKGFKFWLMSKLFLKKGDLKINPIKNITELANNQLLPILSGIKIIHTPGHSAGHIVCLLEKESLLIAADVCANFGSLDYSIFYENPTTALQTLKSIAAIEFEIACFGHGNPIMKNASKQFKKRFSSITSVNN